VIFVYPDITDSVDSIALRAIRTRAPSRRKAVFNAGTSQFAAAQTNTVDPYIDFQPPASPFKRT